MEKARPEREVCHALDEVLAGVDGQRDPIEVVGQLGVRLILQQALEDEVAAFPGRMRYERVGKPVSHRTAVNPGR